ncbi:PREDICTED: uncharacterized protein LOC106786871 isoform X1 [Polistes canadensis]|uniref:uncharacterized protein LOC106786871 isoform X1 n=2 Tax=Polistes canadensis TaxID=91411 RepID=UPI000718E0C7|nr:PREDICTED: uncharacterized protein LOC106786871 isoform X1 [Polistes canadensis]
MAKCLIYNIKVYLLHKYPLLSQYSRKSRVGLLNLCTTQVINISAFFDIHNCNRFYKNDIYKSSVCTKSNQPFITNLSNILSVDAQEATKIWKNIKKCKKLTKDETMNMITIVKNAGLSTPLIVENLPMLIRNIDVLEEKIFCLKTLDSNITEMLPLLDISIKHLNTLIYIGKEKNNKTEINKLKYLADELQCNVYTLYKYIQKDPTIIKLSFRKMRAIVKVLKEFNYDSKDILLNLWIFKYYPRTIYLRTSMMKAAGMEKIKPWIIRSSVLGLREYIKRLKKNEIFKNIYSSHIEFLSKKLNLTEEEVEFYINRSPQLLNLKLQKIDEVINILYKYGYSAQDILMCQRIFLLKTKLLEERLKVLRPLRGQHRLSLIYCSSKIFKTILKNTCKPNNETTLDTDYK